jgi:hypothetical protein
MESFQAIQGFLAMVRKRLYGRAVRQAGLYGACSVLVLACAAPLVSLGVDRVLWVQAPLLCALALVCGLLWWMGVWSPRRRFHRDHDVARWLGHEVPGLHSDLLTAVELAAQWQGTPRFSRELAAALADDTAGRLRGLDVGALVTEAQVRRAAFSLAGAALVALALALPLGGSFRAGWKKLLVWPDLEGQRASDVVAHELIVGDLGMTLTFPAYTGRAPQTIESSSGDILALRGTEVSLETVALVPVVSASLVFEEGGKELPLAVRGRALSGSFRVDRPGSFRFRLVAPGGTARIEAEPHRVEVEADRAPRVELYAPADELEVSSQRRIELGYTVDDDYGISEVALVYRSASGREGRRSLSPARPGARTAESKVLWDLSELPLEPGARISYHIEAKDNDTVFGPNVGSSRTYLLRVVSPRERHAEILAKLEAVLEEALTGLGERLELPPLDEGRHVAAHQASARLIVEVGVLAGLLSQDPMAPKTLEPDLDAMRQRLDKLSSAEKSATLGLGRQRQATPPRSLLAALGEHDRRHVLELERDVILLDDWLGRQRVEEMLLVTDEIRSLREKLGELMKEYKRTGSPEVAKEIERTLRLLEQRLAELDRKRAQLGGELTDRFLNQDATSPSESKSCLEKVRALLAQGDTRGAEAQLHKCGEAMDQEERALEDGLRSLRSEKFGEEQKAFMELMNEIADLEREERDVAGEAEALIEEYERRAAEATRERVAPLAEQAKKTLEALQKAWAEVPHAGLSPFARDEAQAVARRLDDVGRMLSEADVAEALAMARQAREGLRTVLAELEDDLEDAEPFSDRTEEAHDKVAAADPLAAKLIEELEQATPNPGEWLTPDDRRRLEALGKRQEALAERTRKLAEKAEKKGKDMPGRSGDTAHKGLSEAEEKMQRSEKRLGAGDAVGGGHEARGAADKLGELKRTMERSARSSPMGQGGQGRDEEPVRIPGSEEYRAPEEFRGDILDAKKKGRPPEEYRDQVERYYEELVK